MIKHNNISGIFSSIFNTKYFPLILIITFFLSYGLLIPFLGYSLDDLQILLFSKINGGLVYLYLNRRLFLSMIYHIFLPLLGGKPWIWQVISLILRFFSSLVFYEIVKRLFPKYQMIAIISTLFIVVYPAYTIQFSALGHSILFFSFFLFFLASIFFMIPYVENQPYKHFFLFLSVGCSAINLISNEYLFFLELLRPLIIWMLINKGSNDNKLLIAKRIFWKYSPYLILFLGILFWRIVSQPSITVYQVSFLDNINGSFLKVFSDLILTMIKDAWKVFIGSWVNVFSLSKILRDQGPRIIILYVFSIISTFSILYLFLSKNPDCSIIINNGNFKKGYMVLFIFLSFFLAGLPFWLSNLPINNEGLYSRFSLPFIFCSSAFIFFVLFLLFKNRTHFIIVLCIFISFAAGYQLIQADAFRKDWDFEKAFFTNMLWRIPNLAPGTTILSDFFGLKYTQDFGLMAALNLIYSPILKSDNIQYMFYYVPERIGKILVLEPDQPIKGKNPYDSFLGSTNSVIAINFSKESCFRILDPEIDPYNLLISPQMRQASKLSNINLIQLENSQSVLANNFFDFNNKPNNSWCYYFSKAEIARQRGDWNSILEISQAAFSAPDHPNDPIERFPFIEAYAYTGKIDQAIKLTIESRNITPLIKPALCKLWERIERNLIKSGNYSNQIPSLSLNCK